MVAHLVGLQAQEIMPPYIGLWLALEGFDPALSRAAARGAEVVRPWLMRGTIHLATVRDALAFKPLTQVGGTAAQGSGHYGRRTGGADVEALLGRRAGAAGRGAARGARARSTPRRAGDRR